MEQKKRTIAIIAGGDSSEHDVSLRSAQGIYSFMDKERYDCHIIEIKGACWEAVTADGERYPIDKNDFTFSTPQGRIKPDFAYITIHGTPGENGLLQGYLDMIGLPYSTSGVLVEALTFHKFSLNHYLKTWGVKVAESLLIRKGQELNISEDNIISKVGQLRRHQSEKQRTTAPRHTTCNGRSRKRSHDRSLHARHRNHLWVL